MNKFVAAALLACSGCHTFETASWGGGGGSCSRTTDAGTVHNGIAHLAKDGRPYLVLITAGGGSGRVSGGPPGSGSVTAADGRQVEWSCDTRDGVTGKVVIAGQKFRLEDGGVFFLDVRGGGVVIEQAAADMALLEGGFVEERLKALPDPRIAGFLQASESPR
jgi:YD repeat-containing protein